MQQAFDHESLSEPDRMSHPGEHDQDLGDASEPADHMHDTAEEEAAPAGIDGRQLLVDSVDGAKHAPLAVAGERVS